MTDNCLKGINWGQVEVTDNNLSIKNNGKNMMKIPLKKVCNSTVNKNDMVMELKTGELKDY